MDFTLHKDIEVRHQGKASAMIAATVSKEHKIRHGEFRYAPYSDQSFTYLKRTNFCR